MSYTHTYKLKNKDINIYRRLKTSRLFEMAQECSISHTEEIGMGRAKTLDKGLLWVVTQQYMRVRRMPEYDEEVTLNTWPGNTMHVLFPRYYSLLGKNGEQLVAGSALWALMDYETRKVIFPEKHGIVIEGEDNGMSVALPKVVKKEETDHQKAYTVPFSVCDMNGHMNNARYFDLLEDSVSFVREKKQITSAMVNYTMEIRYDETMTISWAEKNNHCYFSGDGNRNHFRMDIEFE